ncbi:MAG: hypothetical protein LUC88_01400 [Prevotella sp.]|nr:hypothetical protein [Prevotella sp.]
MKKIVTLIIMLTTLSVSANAMSYEQARDQALFLTDKMAYELNLTEEQYDAAYEVNLDYLMSITTYEDLYGMYWTRRNLDLSYILLDWQYTAFCAASYFYRPIYWLDGLWHFAIYAHYPRRDYFYFGRPAIYSTYRGAHSWAMNGGRSWYQGRTFNHGGISSGNGMKDRFDRGEFKGARLGSSTANRNTPSTNRTGGNFSGSRSNSTPSTTRNNGSTSRPSSSFGGNRSSSGTGVNSRPSTSSSSSIRNNTSTRPSTFGGNRSGSTTGRVSRESSTRTTVRPTTGSGTSNSGIRTSTSRPSVSSSTTQRQPSSTFTPRTSNSSSSRIGNGSSSSVSRSTPSVRSSSGRGVSGNKVSRPSSSSVSRSSGGSKPSVSRSSSSGRSSSGGGSRSSGGGGRR